MKKLGKLNIHSEKILKNEELIQLSGGYGPSIWNCHCGFGGNNPGWDDPWSGCYTDEIDVGIAVNLHCYEMGTCTPTGGLLETKGSISISL